MKYVLIGILLFSNSILANRIDSLKTDKEIEDFIHQLYIQKYPDYNHKYYSFSIKKTDSTFNDIKCDSVIGSWHLKSWQKIDFNQDSYTDLFAVIYIRNTNDSGASYEICAAIDNGDNSFSLNKIPDYFQVYCYAAVPLIIGNQPYLLYRHHFLEDLLKGAIQDTNIFRYYDVALTDTLIYKFGGFIERSANISNPGIRSIFFETSPCFGVCPYFKMNIYADGAAYRLEDFGDKEGNFRANIKRKDLDRIWGLLNYLNILNLKNDYEVKATDMQTADLKIFFADGKIKTIHDYGMRGSLGLVRLYRLLSELRETQQWR